MEVAVQRGKTLRNTSCFHLISWRQQKKTLFPWNVRYFQSTITQWGKRHPHKTFFLWNLLIILVWLQVRRHRCIQSLAASRCTRIPGHKSSQSSLLIFDLVYHGTVESLYKDTPTLGLKDTYTHTHTPVRRGLVAYEGAGCNSRRPHCGEAHQAGGRRGEARWGVSVGQHFVSSCRRHAVVVLWVTDWPGRTGRGGKRRRITHVACLY